MDGLARVRLPGTLNRARRVPGNNTISSMKYVLILALAAICGTANAQWGITAHSAAPKVCASYKHGKFSGAYGKKARFIAIGSSYRKAVRRRAKKWGK